MGLKKSRKEDRNKQFEVGIAKEAAWSWREGQGTNRAEAESQSQNIH